MDPELKREMQEIHALAKDNHQMLRAIRRHQWYSVIWTIVVWIVVLALPLYLYQQYVAPLISQFSANPGEMTSGILGFPTSVDIEKLINSLKGG